MITVMNSGSLLFRRLAKSSKVAVAPETYTVIVVRDSAAGITRERRRVMRLLVAAVSGAEAG